MTVLLQTQRQERRCLMVSHLFALRLICMIIFRPQTMASTLCQSTYLHPILVLLPQLQTQSLLTSLSKLFPRRALHALVRPLTSLNQIRNMSTTNLKEYLHIKARLFRMILQIRDYMLLNRGAYQDLCTLQICLRHYRRNMHKPLCYRTTHPQCHLMNQLRQPFHMAWRVPMDQRMNELFLTTSIRHLR